MLAPDALQAGLLLLLLLLYALLNLLQAVLGNMRKAPLNELAAAGHAGAQRALALDAAPQRLKLTWQAGSLLLLLAMAWLLRSALLPAAGDGLQQLLLVLAAGLLLLTVGALLPAALGAAWADRLAPPLAGVATLLLWLAWPALALLLPLSRLLERLTGASTQTASVTEAEIMTLVDAGQKEGTIEDEEKAMIFSVLQFTDTLVREVMVPRIDVISVARDTALREALGLFVASGHSRLPVHNGNIDHVEGLLYAKDLLAAWYSDAATPAIHELMRPAYFVTEDRRADLVLKELQTSKIHLAIVIDEYGGTAGVVSVENLVEEIVGDIQDEYDTREEAEYVQQAEDEYSIDASMDLHDVNELLQVDLPTASSDTLGGFIIDSLGRVPQPGEVLSVTDHGLNLRIDSLDGRRIRKVQVTRAGQSLAS